MRWGARLGAGALALAIVASLVSGVQPVTAKAAFQAVGSARQVYVTGLGPSEQASLVAPDGSTSATAGADPQGGLLFRDVPPGTGYRVVDAAGSSSGPLVVHDDSAAPWDPGVYDQQIPDSGYGYLTTRDGTKLSIDVHPPTSPAGEPGLPAGTTLPSVPHGDFLPPYPTLIEYSGYGYADPAGPVNGIAVLANLMGFAVVDVNMRGTGCSGGAFDFFEALQDLDGYDVIETIAHQPWVLGHKVGMMGISYGGISQLFTAQLDPPHLAAIAPLSVIDATATTLYPGGILNTGFAVAWAQERQQEATPATATGGGQPWADQRIAQGDTTCAANQVLHGEATDLMAKIDANDYYDPAVADPLDPVTFVDKIDVPVFMACQWEDEQTGGHCAQLVSHFTGTDQKWFTFTNGAHIDSLDPDTYNRLYDFLELFVAHQAPIVNAAISHAAAPVVYQAAMGLPQTDVVTLPADPVQAMATYDLALAAFEMEPPVRVLFDNGAGTSPTGSTDPGNPYPGFSQGFASLPVPGTAAQTWYLGPGGTLGDGLPAGTGVDEYTSDASALPLTDYASGGNTGGGGLWGDASQWQWHWVQSPAGTAVSYVSPPLATDTTVVGGGAVYLWVRSSTPDVDLQATVSEVRPDGKETFVQDGWLRASERKLSTSPDGSDNLFKQPSTLLDPLPTFTAADAAPMPGGRFVQLSIPLYYEGHVYRAGSRLRLTVAAPNGAQPVWSFGRTEPDGTMSPTSTATVSVEFSPTRPSMLVLPVVPGLGAPTPLPPCPGLRNEPCRAYQPTADIGAPG
ncbi:MAG: CocE/NonD family hydrolase [Acidobacteriota bacterium]|nr:CocE/NonD family hydrolase [Acidobacteriota bacterium]